MPSEASTIVPSTSHRMQVHGDRLGMRIQPMGAAAASAVRACLRRRRALAHGPSEQPRGAGVDALHAVVVEGDAADAAIRGQHARLGLDLLRGEHARHRREVRVAPEQLEVARELLDAVDVAAALDLDGDRAARRDPAAAGRPGRSRSGTRGARASARRRSRRPARRAAAAGRPRRRPSRARGRCRARATSRAATSWMRTSRASPVLAWVTRHSSTTPSSASDSSGASTSRRARRAHPVERLVRAAVGVHEQAAVALVDEQAGGQRQVRVEATGVVHRAAGDDEAHPTSLPDARRSRRARRRECRVSPSARAVACRPCGCPAPTVEPAIGLAAPEARPDATISATRMYSVLSRPMCSLMKPEDRRAAQERDVADRRGGAHAGRRLGRVVGRGRHAEREAERDARAPQRRTDEDERDAGREDEQRAGPTVASAASTRSVATRPNRSTSGPPKMRTTVMLTENTVEAERAERLRRRRGPRPCRARASRSRRPRRTPCRA